MISLVHVVRVDIYKRKLVCGWTMQKEAWDCSAAYCDVGHYILKSWGREPIPFITFDSESVIHLLQYLVGILLVLLKLFVLFSIRNCSVISMSIMTSVTNRCVLDSVKTKGISETAEWLHSLNQDVGLNTYIRSVMRLSDIHKKMNKSNGRESGLENLNSFLKDPYIYSLSVL